MLALIFASPLTIPAMWMLHAIGSMLAPMFAVFYLADRIELAMINAYLVRTK